MNKLRIGDKIKWNVAIGGDIIYTIIDIDTSRVLSSSGFNEEVLFEWEDFLGEVRQLWCHSYDGLNERLLMGGIIIVERDIEPIKEIKKFTL